METAESLNGELGWLIGLIEGEGSFSVSRSRSPWGTGRFSVEMTDEDVMNRAAKFLNDQGIEAKVRHVNSRGVGRDGVPWRDTYVIQVGRAELVRKLIDLCYPYFSDKKQSDCDKVLKNLADRGLL